MKRIKNLCTYCTRSMTLFYIIFSRTIRKTRIGLVVCSARQSLQLSKYLPVTCIDGNEVAPVSSPAISIVGEFSRTHDINPVDILQQQKIQKLISIQFHQIKKRTRAQELFFIFRKIRLSIINGIIFFAALY